MKKKIRTNITCSRNDSIIIMKCNICNEKQEIIFPKTIKEFNIINISKSLNECYSFSEKHYNCKRKNNVKLLNK